MPESVIFAAIRRLLPAISQKMCCLAKLQIYFENCRFHTIAKVPICWYLHSEAGLEVTAMKRLPVIILLVSLLISCMTSEGALFESVIGAVDEEEPAKETAPGSTPGQKETEEPEEEEPHVEEVGIKVVSQPGDAQIYINNEFVGTGSILITPKPGSYQISVRRQGYYSQSVWTQYDNNTLVVVSIALEEITGYLYLEVQPPGTNSTANGRPISEGVTELQIGTYGLRVRKFGYEDWRGAVTIIEMNTTKVIVDLKEAAFELKDLGLTRKVFNPKNPGKLGTVKITFEVTSWGDGAIIVTDAKGLEVYSRPLRQFSTWEQSLEWDGRDDTGRQLDDGVYYISIDAKGRKSGEPVELRTSVTIDSSAVISYRSTFSGISGTLFSPLPAVLPAGSFQVNAGIIGHYSVKRQEGRYPAFAAVRVGLGQDSEVDLQGALFVGPEDPLPFSGGVGFKYKLPEMEFVALGFTGKLTYVGNTSVDTFHNYTGLSVGMISALKTRPLILTISPEIVVSPYSVIYPKSPRNAGFNVWGYGRLGILADFGALTAGLSASVRTIPFAGGFDLQPPYSAGAEIHWLIPGTQIVLSGFVTTELGAVNYLYVMGGAGVGFIN